MQEQVDDRELAGLARHRVAAARPTASADVTVLGPVPAALDCPYLHLDDGPSCLALAPAIRLSRRQVEIVCAVAAHVSCPRLIKADAGRVPVQIDPPPARARREDRPPTEAADPGGLAAAAAALTLGETATAGASAGAALAAATTLALEQPTETAEVAEPAEEAAGEPSVPATPARTPPPAPPVAAATTDTRGGARRAAGTSSEPRQGPGRIAAALTTARATARLHITLRPATAIAWLIFVGAVVVVIAILSAGGNLTLRAVASPSAAAVVTSPSVAPATPTLVASPSPSTSPSPSASASPSATASAPPSPSPSAASPFTPEQLALLKPCPGKPGCYQYRIVSGDNLRSVATFFGVEYPALLAANPQITNPSVIHVGDPITIPPPTPKATPTP